jgi:hypothetical protein
MEPTYIDGKASFDGGVRDVLPLERAVELGAERIVPIFLDPEKLETSESEYKGIKEVALRTVMICMDEIVRNDYLQAKYLQCATSLKSALYDKVGRSGRVRKKLKEVFDSEEFRELFGSQVVEILDGLRPDKVMTYDMLTFEPDSMRRWLRWGEEKAGEVFTESPFQRR